MPTVIYRVSFSTGWVQAVEPSTWSVSVNRDYIDLPPSTMISEINIINTFDILSDKEHFTHSSLRMDQVKQVLMIVT